MALSLSLARSLAHSLHLSLRKFLFVSPEMKHTERERKIIFSIDKSEASEKKSNENSKNQQKCEFHLKIMMIKCLSLSSKEERNKGENKKINRFEFRR